MNATIKAIAAELHSKHMLDPVYADGYNSPNHWVAPYFKNPHPFDTETNLKLNRIAIINPPLTKEETTELVRLRDILDASDWQRWSRGNYYRWCIETA